MDIVNLLREQAAEIAAEGHFGWGNTMLEAATIIEQLKAAQQSVHPTVLAPCACGGERQLLTRCQKCRALEAHSG